MNSSDTRVSSYLDDLARMLADLDPADRDEVLAGVREHLDATLAEHPDDPAAVDAALLRLGPPERVAAQARADLAPAPAAPAWSAPPPVHHPVRVRFAAGVSLATIALPVAGSLVGRVVDLLGNSSGSVPPLHPGEVAMLLLPLLLPFWLVSTVVAVLGSQPTTRTKIRLALLGPAMTVSVLVATLLQDPMAVSTPLSLVLLTGLLVGVVLTARRVWREAPVR